MVFDKVMQEISAEATRNKTFYEVCLVLACRERSRNTLTVTALVQKMKEEGFEHQPGDYREVILKLHAFGIGELMKSARGTAVGLKNLEVTLQSIGQAGVGTGVTLDTYKGKLRQEKLPLPKEVVHEIVGVEAPKPMTINLTINIKGVPVNMSMPANGEVISELINKLKVS